MKNYSKNYFKTKFTQDVLGEEVDNSTKILINDAITKHNNINEGYSPHGRDRGSVTTDARVEYIKEFTNFNSVFKIISCLPVNFPAFRLMIFQIQMLILK